MALDRDPSNKLKDEVKSEGENNLQKHWFCSINTDRELQKQAKIWVGRGKDVNNGDYDWLPPSSSFEKIKNDDVLHIHCHGAIRRVKNKPESVLFIKTKTDNGFEDKPHNAEEFLMLLKDKKLDQCHKFLEINACYSASFAKEFSAIAGNNYSNMKVVGYEKQFLSCKGKNGGHLAGIDMQYVMESEERFCLNKEKIEEDFGTVEKFEDFFAAENFKQTFICKSDKKLTVTPITNEDKLDNFQQASLTTQPIEAHLSAPETSTRSMSSNTLNSSSSGDLNSTIAVSITSSNSSTQVSSTTSASIEANDSHTGARKSARLMALSSTSESSEPSLLSGSLPAPAQPTNDNEGDKISLLSHSSIEPPKFRR